MNKSVRVLLFFAVFLLAACGKISVFVTPTGVTDCTIDVRTCLNINFRAV